MNHQIQHTLYNKNNFYCLRYSKFLKKKQIIIMDQKELTSTWKEFEAALKSDHLPFVTGLKNLNNTCYINAILQCLFSIKPLAPIFMSHHLINLSMTDRKLVLLKSFIKLLFKNWSNEELDKYVSAFCEKIFDKGTFPKGYQQDAHEFMLSLFNWFEDSFNYAKQSRAEAIGSSQIVGESITAVNTALEFMNDLYVTIKQKITCENGHISETEEERNILTLSVLLEHMNLNQCIANFFSTENFPSCTCSNRNVLNNNCCAYDCTSCGKHVKATKIIFLTKLPEYLVINLKIFKMNDSFQVRYFALFLYSLVFQLLFYFF
jgi:ubiquitin C-terminal hydrolase